MNKSIVYYCYLVNKYKKLIANQMQRLIDSKLYDNVDKIYVNLYGDSKLMLDQVNWFTQFEKVVIWSVNTSDTNLYEYQGLACAWDVAKISEPEDRILYLHTKGISRNNTLDQEIWRNAMEHELIDKWEEANAVLDGTGVVGINLKNYPFFHFSGNLWWAKCGNIQSLHRPRLVEDEIYRQYGMTNRHYYEFWIGTGENKHQMKQLAKYDVGYNKLVDYPQLDKKYFI